MSERLNASGYPYAEDDYRNEFETILSKIIVCYNLMLANNVMLRNDENSIRDYMLYNYFKKQWFKEEYKLIHYLFDPELPENTGRIDIRIIPVNPLINDDAYYIIECKRLNAKNQAGKTGLNAEYISEGMCRFTSKKYSSYFRINGMIGFIVQPINISENVASINKLLKNTFTEANTSEELKYQKLVPKFYFSYCSTHHVDGSDIVIYHLMLNFSNHIQ